MDKITINDSNVLIIYTGGTIGMIEDEISGCLHPFDFSHLKSQIKELNRFECNIDSISLFENPKDSSDITPKDWIKIAQIIKTNYTKYDGFVVLHGTDTMSYSASALSFILENNTKPIIFTGSQLPIGKIRTDGKENFVTSIEIAASKINGKPIVPEICIFFESYLYRANRTYKSSAEDFDAFRSRNYPALARAGVNIIYNFKAINQINPSNKVFIHDKLETQIGIIKFFPGMPTKPVIDIFRNKKYKAIILETYGAGNIPKLDLYLSEIIEALKDGKIIVNLSQCRGGSVEHGKYKNNGMLDEIGVVSGKDITLESMMCKLMYLLGKDLSREKIIENLKRPLRGEMK